MSKSIRQDKRKAEKAKRKAARKALYLSYRDSGRNKKSKRYQMKAKRVKQIRAKRKASQKSLNFSPFLTNGAPRHMPQWMYQKWQQAQKGLT